MLTGRLWWHGDSAPLVTTWQCDVWCAVSRYYGYCEPGLRVRLGSRTAADAGPGPQSHRRLQSQSVGRARDLRPGERRDQASESRVSPVPGPRHSVDTRPGPGAVRHYHCHHDVMITVTQWPVMWQESQHPGCPVTRRAIVYSGKCDADNVGHN